MFLALVTPSMPPNRRDRHAAHAQRLAGPGAQPTPYSQITGTDALATQAAISRRSASCSVAVANWCRSAR